MILHKSESIEVTTFLLDSNLVIITKADTEVI